MWTHAQICSRLGAVLYEMATGKLPFPGDSLGEICGAILHKEPVPPSQLNPKISRGLEAVILRALEKDRTCVISVLLTCGRNCNG